MLNDNLTYRSSASCSLTNGSIQSRGLFSIIRSREQHVKGNLGFEIAVGINLEFVAGLRVKGVCVGESFGIDFRIRIDLDGSPVF